MRSQVLNSLMNFWEGTLAPSTVIIRSAIEQPQNVRQQIHTRRVGRQIRSHAVWHGHAKVKPAITLPFGNECASVFGNLQ